MTRKEHLLRDVPGRVTAILAGALLMIGCGDDPAAPPDGDPPETTEVGVLDNRFDPSANAVGVGATVTWSWGGQNPHNVTFDDPEIGSSATQAAGVFERTFDEAGEFTYFCTIHGRSVMSGRVVVGE